MPRSFEVTTETSARVADVLAAFGDRDYWLARLAAYGGDSMTLDSLVVEPHGTIAVTTSQDLRHDVLPPAIARALPGNTTIIRTESWQPADDRVRGKFTIAARGVPASGNGTLMLKPAVGGSSLRVAGTLEVRIPLVGGRIERFIADLVAKDVPEMQQYTADWIGRSGELNA